MNSNKILAIIFSVVYAVLAFLLAGLLSIHGPDLMPVAVLAYFIVAATVLWLTYFFFKRRSYKYKDWLFLLTALAVGGALVLASSISRGLLFEVDNYYYRKRAANTKVSDMKDEVLLSPSGNPIGIRLSYSVDLPDSGYFGFRPMVWPDKNYGVSIQTDMRLAALSVDPPLLDTNTMRHEKRTYKVVADTVPYFIQTDYLREELCILYPPTEYQSSFEKILTDSADPGTKYHVSIPETTYQALTENYYSPKIFYAGALKEGAGRCESLMHIRKPPRPRAKRSP